MKFFLRFLPMLALTFSLSAQTTKFYCTSSGGSPYGGGLLYSVDGAGGNYQDLYDFPYAAGGTYSNIKLAEAPNGKLYGIYYGTIYEYDPVTAAVHEAFIFSEGNSGSCSQNVGGMTLAPNNKFYGLILSGGLHSNGFLFEYDYITGTATRKIDFDGANNGACPHARLLLANNGKLYGVTQSGGANNLGVFFEYDYGSNTLTKKIDFSSALTGAGSNPNPHMVQGTNNKIYGACQFGANGGGAIFEYDIPGDSIRSVYSFLGTPDGHEPWGGLEAGNNGKLYGTTTNGGTAGQGTIFEFDYNLLSYTQKISLTTVEGGNPELMVLLNNKFFVSTSNGGANTYGSYLSYDYITNSLVTLFPFAYPAQPYIMSKLTYHTNGKLYGLCNIGNGSICEVDTFGNMIQKIKFLDAINGFNPQELTFMSGNLYGTTFEGGIYGRGTIFKYDINASSLSKLFDFDNFGNGNNPYGAIVPSSATTFWGTASNGGANGDGQFYEFDVMSNTYNPLGDFNSSTLGSSPTGYFAKHSNGKIYGTCSSGGGASGGTIYELDPGSLSLLKKYDFTNPLNGSSPDGIMLAGNNKFYGVATDGGTNGNGAIFQFTPPASYVKKVDFSSAATGDYPLGRLLEATPGVLYGLTSGGGTYDRGVLFKYTIASNTLQKLVDFDSTNYGSYPQFSLTLGAGGKIYGSTFQGGAYNKGVLFEYDYVNDIMTKKMDFNGTTGNYGGTLTLVCGTPNYSAGSDQAVCLNSQITLGTAAEAGYVYNWSPVTGLSNSNVANPVLTAQGATITYSVTGSYLTCSFTDSLKITPVIAATPDICMVTVDSLSQNNILYWDKTSLVNVDTFYVYRDTANNNYACIGKVPYDSLSQFVDTVRSLYAANGDPNASSWRYKIAVKDSCGNIGPMSPYHQTMFFQHNTGNFNWSPYQIEGQTTPIPALSNYLFKRDDISSGIWNTIQTLSASSVLYTDANYSTYQATGSWRVETSWSITCNPTLKLTPAAMAAVSKSRSNVQNNFAVTGINTITEKDFVLMPNPANDFIVIQSRPTMKNVVVEVYDLAGRLVLPPSNIPPDSYRDQHSININTSNLSNGIYSVRIISGNGKAVKKLVIEK